MSSEDEAMARLDRHALVLAVWLPAGFVALGLLHHGFGVGGAWWVAAGFAALLFLPVACGMIALLLAAVFYMLTRFGTRAAFDNFDIIRDNNPRRASRLNRRGRR